MSARVLVTGGRGYLGRRIVDALRAEGRSTLSLSRSDSGGADSAVLDLLSASTDDAARLLQRESVTHIVHSAWDVRPGYWTAPANTAWLRASLRLYEAARAAGVRRFVSVGTCAEFDWRDAALMAAPIPDAAPSDRPHTPYGAVKSAFHRVLAAYADDEGGPSCAWGRLFFPLGPGEHEGRLIPYLVRTLSAGDRAAVTEGDVWRDFIDVRDAGRAFAALAVSDVVGAVNIASGEAVLLRDVVAAVGEALERPDLIDFGARPTGPDEPMRLVASTRRLTRELSFQPRHALSQTIGDAVRSLLGPGEAAKPH